MRLAIVGCGLIGGSIAAASREKSAAVRITAIDRSDVIADPAVQRLSDVQIDVRDESALVEAFAAADLVVLATPVSAIIDALELALRNARVVTDCGSTNDIRIHNIGDAVIVDVPRLQRRASPVRDWDSGSSPDTWSAAAYSARRGARSS